MIAEEAHQPVCKHYKHNVLTDKAYDQKLDHGVLIVRSGER